MVYSGTYKVSTSCLDMFKTELLVVCKSCLADIPKAEVWPHRNYLFAGWNL